MKKLALFAMLLGSTFVFGCEKPAEKPKTEGDKAPAAGTDTKPADEKPADTTKPADEKPADTKPAEPAK
jgi:hypothetical protein